jgi:hypothetical protein
MRCATDPHPEEQAVAVATARVSKDSHRLGARDLALRDVVLAEARTAPQGEVAIQLAEESDAPH